MIETQAESSTDNNNTKTETTVAVLTSEVKVLSIGHRREYFKPKKPVIKFDKQIFFNDCRKHFGQLLLGNQTPFVSKNIFKMDVLEMDTIELDKQPRRYQFHCLPCSSPYMEFGVFGLTLYASAVMHELKRRLKDKKWISKNILEFPKKEAIVRSRNSYVDDYYIHNMVIDIIHEQKMKVFQFLLHLHKEYEKERQSSMR